MNDRLFNAFIRGFGWTVGRRAASQVPLWLTVVLIVGWHFMKGSNS